MLSSQLKEKKESRISINKQKSVSSKPIMSNPNSARHDTRIKIRVLPAKFIDYLNQLNSSIQTCKKRTSSRNNHSSQRRSSVDSSDLSSVASKISHNNVQKKKTLKKQEYSVLQGTKANGKLHGLAKLRFSNGAIFKGQIQQGELKEGIIQFIDGTEYSGGFKDFMFHGSGRLKNKNGTQYIGVFNNGALKKKAEIIYDNGDVYKGQVQNYKKHGQGQLKMKNGNRFVGQFVNGEITGFGIYYVNEFPIAEGDWKNGEFLGKGEGTSDLGAATNSDC